MVDDAAVESCRMSPARSAKSSAWSPARSTKDSARLTGSVLLAAFMAVVKAGDLQVCVGRPDLGRAQNIWEQCPAAALSFVHKAPCASGNSVIPAPATPRTQ